MRRGYCFFNRTSPEELRALVQPLVGSVGGQQALVAVTDIAPTDIAQMLDEITAREDLITSMFFYITRYAETQLTTEQKELLYDIWDEHNAREYGDTEPSDRWWRQ